jgi:hypothetical protein
LYAHAACQGNASDDDDAMVPDRPQDIRPRFHRTSAHKKTTASTSDGHANNNNNADQTVHGGGDPGGDQLSDDEDDEYEGEGEGAQGEWNLSEFLVH